MTKFPFPYFRQLRCDRITIHKNLFLSYVLTGVSWILYYIFVALDGDVLIDNPVSTCHKNSEAIHKKTFPDFVLLFISGFLDMHAL